MGLKEATKDIDAIAKHGRDMKAFAETLSNLGYRALEEPGEEYLKLGTQLIYENKDGCRFDIFLERVVGLLFLSEGMEKRSTEMLAFSNLLKLKLASKEDIFLFKSITPRKADLEDMNMLIQAGLDFDAILKEISVQKELTRRELWIPLIKEKLDKLNDMYGVVVPIKKQIDEMTGEIYKKLELLRLIHEQSMTLSQLERKSPLEGNEVKRLLRDLIRLKIVKKREEKLELTTTAY